MIKKRKKILKGWLRLVFFCFVFFCLFLLGLFAYFAKDLPSPDKISQHQITQSTKIYDRTGQIVLYDIHGEEKRTVIPLEDIPAYLKQATIAIEDANFYHHFGLDFRGILRAFWANLKNQEIKQGGSTITQQYIKNTYLGGPRSQRTLSRKIKEAILALELELKYSKDEILGFYLNQVPYGSNAYGIEAASQTFFDQPAKKLSLAQAALLAALPKAPSYYSPYGSHFQELKERQEYILTRMSQLGYITAEQAQAAKKEELKFKAIGQLKAYHFVAMVKEYLEEKYSQQYGDIDKAGLKVYTTLDWPLQQLAEEIVSQKAEINQKKYRADNAALVALDPQSGQLLALVGSKNYSQEQFNVATSPFRQPGSAFKPFAYAAAFLKGYNPKTILFDVQTNFGSFGGKDYIPQNYDQQFRGPVSMSQALAQSINLPSVKTLYLAGLDQTIDLAQQMGITTLKDRSRLGLSLVLGGGEVKLIDLTAAYGVLAAEGVRHPLYFIQKIEDSQGRILEQSQKESKRVLDEQTSRQINQILSDEAARAPMFGSRSALYLAGIPAAAKTGTTQDYSDGWTIGYTPNLTVGVWAGNNDFQKKMVRGAAGLYVAAPIWHDFMIKAYELKKPGSEKEFQANEFVLPQETKSFTPPEPVPLPSKPMLNGQPAWQSKVKIDKISGKLATEFTPPELIEEKTYQEVHSILYYLDKDNPLADFSPGSSQDPQLANWEKGVLNWLKTSCSGTSCPVSNQQPPSEYDDIHVPENQPTIKIISPKNNQLISQKSITVQVEAQAPLGIKQVDFFFNQRFIETDSREPFSITFNPWPYLTTGQAQTIKVRAYDQVLNRKEAEISVYVY